MIRCIAVDDEPLALVQIKKYISEFPELQLVGTYLSVKQAKEALENEKVDLAFLDIEMPGCSGMEFAHWLNGRIPYLIFTTAYSEYALEGFKVEAVDYLLKPMSLADMRKAVDRVIKRSKVNQASDSAESSGFFVKSNGQNVRLLYDDISYIKGLGEYVQFFLKSRQSPITALYSMRHLEEALPPEKFMRIHKSYIVNLESCTAALPSSVKVDGETLPLGDTYKKALQQYIKEKRL